MFFNFDKKQVRVSLVLSTITDTQVNCFSNFQSYAKYPIISTSSLFLVDEATTKSKHNVSEKTTELSLKYSYPALWIFKNFVL